MVFSRRSRWVLFYISDVCQYWTNAANRWVWQDIQRRQAPLTLSSTASLWFVYLSQQNKRGKLKGAKTEAEAWNNCVWKWFCVDVGCRWSKETGSEAQEDNWSYVYWGYQWKLSVVELLLCSCSTFPVFTRSGIGFIETRFRFWQSASKVISPFLLATAGYSALIALEAALLLLAVRWKTLKNLF